MGVIVVKAMNHGSLQSITHSISLGAICLPPDSFNV